MEARVKFANGFFKDAGKCSAPAGVNGGDSALFGIDEKNRGTVGRLDAEKKSRRFGERSVTLAGFFRAR